MLNCIQLCYNCNCQFQVPRLRPNSSTSPIVQYAPHSSPFQARDFTTPCLISASLLVPGLIIQGPIPNLPSLRREHHRAGRIYKYPLLPTPLCPLARVGLLSPLVVYTYTQPASTTHSRSSPFAVSTPTARGTTQRRTETPLQENESAHPPVGLCPRRDGAAVHRAA